MNTLTLFRTIALTGVLASCLFSQDAPKAPRVRKAPVFVTQSLPDDVAMITPPPAGNSEKMAKDVAEIFAIHRLANPKEIEAARWDNDHENLFAVARVLGSDFTPEKMPATAALWADMDNDQGLFVTAAKKYFQHIRPYDLDPAIKSLCGSKPGGPKNSYPSGHGTTGYLSALVLSMMVPEKSEILHARADEYGHSRVVCGDHYASDIPASKEAAEIIMGNMISSPKFQQEFAAAKTEVRKALGLR
jgi:acid phosphatase (class A)